MTDLLLLGILMLNLFIVSSSRLGACVRATALQGLLLALLPIALANGWDATHILHTALTSGGTLLLKAFVIPFLLFRAIREANVRREVEPFVSLHTSVVLGAVLVGISFWLSTVLVLPRAAPTTVLVPVAFAAILLGFLVLVSRKKAVTQVVGYLMLENGVFLFGLTLAREIPFVVELGILLDVFVGVFVFGIAIYHIGREFDHIDTDALSTLKD
jgi:hydrogenase-4 component E